MRMSGRFSLAIAGAALLGSVAFAGGKYSGGAGDGYGSAASVATGLGGTALTLALPGVQNIARAWTNVPCSTVTVGDGTPAAITAAGDLRLTIPAALIQTWDTTVTAPTFGGSAAGSVAASVTYANGGRTLVVDVTGNFADGGTLTISGLVFTNLTQACLPERLTLDIHNDGLADAWSDKVVGVTMLRPGGLGDGGDSFTMAQAVPLVVPGETLILVR
jgi:hypothetical protein